MSINDNIFKNLRGSQGGSLNERVYHYLGGLGYTGPLSERLNQFSYNGKVGWLAVLEKFGLEREFPFVLASVFDGGDQGVAYVAQPTVAGQQVLFQDSAGTIPVTGDGDPVGLMLDLSGNGNHAVQTSDALRPTYRRGDGLHWLTFNGTGDRMETAPFSMISSGKGLLAVVGAEGNSIRSLTQYDSTLNERVWAFGAAAIDGSFTVQDVPTGFDSTQVAAGTCPDTRSTRTGTWMPGQACQLRFNGGATSSASAVTNAFTSLSRILEIYSINGSNVSAGNFYGAVVAESSDVYGKVDDVESYVGSLVGLTI